MFRAYTADGTRVAVADFYEDAIAFAKRLRATIYIVLTPEGGFANEKLVAEVVSLGEKRVVIEK